MVKAHERSSGVPKHNFVTKKSAKKQIRNFQGAITALVTPFRKNGEVDYEAMKKLVEFQIKSGIDAIAPVGTTGESPTLTEDEDVEVVKTVVNQARGRVPIIAGAGSNCTKKAVEMSKRMEKAGADGILSVCPYYNKPTQKGFYLHFAEIAKAVKIPIVLYNVPGRTGKKMDNDVTIRLANDFKNIVAIKDATGDLENMKDLIRRAPKGFNVISGDDNLTYDLMKSGGKGIISVASNIIPADIKKLTSLCAAGKFSDAEQLSNRLMPLFRTIFIETNPIPIKTALAMQGKIKEEFRLPMCAMEPDNKEKLRKVLKDRGLV